MEAAHTAARSECAALQSELDSANATLQQLKAQQAEVLPQLLYNIKQILHCRCPLSFYTRRCVCATICACSSARSMYMTYAVLQR
jgi:hypothetical protein